MNPLIEQWQRICILAERIIKRREAAAVRMSSPFRRPFIPAHLLPVFPSSNHPLLSDSASIASSAAASGLSASTNLSESTTLNNSIIGSSLWTNSFDYQGDLSRLTNTVRAVIEVSDPCWRGDECELSGGVRTGLEEIATHCQRHSELSENRVSVIRSLNQKKLLKLPLDAHFA